MEVVAAILAIVAAVFGIIASWDTVISKWNKVFDPEGHNENPKPGPDKSPPRPPPPEKPGAPDPGAPPSPERKTLASGQVQSFIHHLECSGRRQGYRQVHKLRVMGGLPGGKPSRIENRRFDSVKYHRTIMAFDRV